jgi:prepilin-type N-terminal cleavage/methylation domain-containing protein
MMKAESGRATWAGAVSFCILHSSFCIQRRSAFTLIEMLVSLAVLSLALGIVGYVFSVTTKTASQAMAYSQTHAWVREFTRQLQEDLDHCDPAQSVLVMVGRTQAAALTQTDLDAGKYYRVLVGNPQDAGLAGYDPEYANTVDPNGQYSDPRADLLMFFSNRPTASMAPHPYLPNPTADPYANGVKFSPIRVVYGHAALGKPVWYASTGSYQFPAPGSLQHIEQTKDLSNQWWTLSKIPATRWHLSRVATIIDPGDPNTIYMQFPWRFSLDACQEVSRGKWYNDSYNSAAFLPGDAALMDFAEMLRSFGPSYFGVNDAPTLSPYFWAGFTNPHGQWQAQNVDSVNTLLYATGTVNNPAKHHVATVLEDVPVDLKSNLAVHMLPGCVWFQVEFLMPEDPRNSATYFADPNAPFMSRRYDMPRWMSVMPGSTYVFVPDTQQNRNAVASQTDVAGFPINRLADFARLDQTPGNDPNNAVGNRIVRMWPYAIRITVRVWDARGVLPEPIVRTVVHRFE